MSAIAGAVEAAGSPGVTVAADARLDERVVLAGHLGVRSAEVSDPELIRLAYLRWGDGCVDRILGDFAFVVHDGPRRKLLAARDPLGVKPLHYQLAGARLTFATHTGDLFALGVPRIPDERRIADALVPELEGIDAETTFFERVRRLPPAHRLVVEDGRATLSRWWTPDPSRELRLRDDREYEEAFLATLSAAVASRLDAGTAAMLSGGLDSSAIAGIARRLRPVTTVSAVTRDPGCEETAHVRRVLAGGRLDPILLFREDAAAHAGALDRFLAGWAEPFDAAMVLPVLVYAAARERGAGSVLDGVDGDAVASLEPDYLDALLRSGSPFRAVREARGLTRFYRHADPGFPSPARLLAGSLRRAIVPVPALDALRRWRRGGRHRASLRDSLIHPDLARRVRIDERLNALAAHRPAGRSLDPRARQAAELTHPYLAAALERYARAAASQGVEARHPFLDRRVVELGLALPWDQKVRDGWSKAIVRRAMDGVLPDAVRWRPGRWVRLGPLFLEDAIAARFTRAGALAADTVSALAPFVDLDAWRRLVDRFEVSRGPIDGASIWQTLLLSRWLRAYDARAHLVGEVALSPRAHEARATMVAMPHE
jgi:asparagine synthase (glutamine-hydrolysing)